MEFHAGDKVINPSMPQWGVGEVLAVTEGMALALALALMSTGTALLGSAATLEGEALGAV